MMQVLSSFVFRVNELTMLNEKLKIHLEEKNRTISTLQRNISQLDSRADENRAHEEQDIFVSRQVRMETNAMHSALRDIAEAVISDADQNLSPVEENIDAIDAASLRSSPSRARSTSPRSKSPQLRTRSISPRARSPAFADATFSAVQAALNKRQLQVQELRAKLVGSRDQNSSLRRHADEIDTERRHLENQLLQMRDDMDNA